MYMMDKSLYLCFFFFNDTATTEIYTLSLHDALPISVIASTRLDEASRASVALAAIAEILAGDEPVDLAEIDRKSTRLNSSHANISYAVFCLKKKKLTNMVRLITLDTARIAWAIRFRT